MVVDSVDRRIVGELVKFLRPFHPCKFDQGLTISGPNPAKRTYDLHLRPSLALEKGLPPNAILAEADEHIAGRITDALRMYSDQYRTFDPPDLHDTGFLLMTYAQGGGYYREHIDGSSWGPVSERILSIVVYLNDVEEGGETAFPIQGLEVQPRAGRIVVFPASWTHPHEAKVPVSGDKWIISTFIYNHSH